MYSHFGTIDVACDAPPHSVAEVCRELGFLAPLDVRWCRMSNFNGGPRANGGALRALLSLFSGRSDTSRKNCTCGKPLPEMTRYTCTFESGKQAHYLLGQCLRCRTMFWEEASAPSRKEAELGSTRGV
jgi:hypothetical protein